MIYIAEGIAGGDILEADCCSDIAGVSTVDFLTMVCMHLKDTANAFFLSFCGVQNVGALVHDTGVYTEECQFTNEWVIGAVSDASRVTSSPSRVVPLTGGTSSGDGR